MTKGITRKWKFIFVWAIFSLIIFATWLYFLQPFRKTRLYGQEMARAVQQFREVRGDLNTRLQPERLLSVANENYFPTFLDWNQVGMCEECDRFWVVTFVEVVQIRVIEYSPIRSQVRAKIVVYGHQVNSKSYERLMFYDVPKLDIATYIFLRDTPTSQWMLEDMLDYAVPDLMNPNEVKLDDFLLFDWEEIKSDE